MHLSNTNPKDKKDHSEAAGTESEALRRTNNPPSLTEMELVVVCLRDPVKESVIFLQLCSIAHTRHSQQDSCPFVRENPFQLNRAARCLCERLGYDLTSVKNTQQNASQLDGDKLITQTGDHALSGFAGAV